MTRRRLPVLLAALLLASCQMGDGMDNGMGMGLGDSAETVTLAEGTLAQLTAGGLVWAVYQATGNDRIEHVHAGGFVYALDGPHTLTLEGEERTLAEGEALFLEFGADHSHHDGNFWDVTLATLQPEGAPAVAGAESVFVSDRLEGIPAPPVRVFFIEVALPGSGGQTAAHSHPGPEFIYVTDGPIEYQTALAETEQLADGDHRALAADTAVQKRNPRPERARFLSWFVVDPDRPFASEAEFD